MMIDFPTVKAFPLSANFPVLVGPVAAMPPEAVAHVARLDALLSIATLDVSLGALPTAAV